MLRQKCLALGTLVLAMAVATGAAANTNGNGAGLSLSTSDYWSGMAGVNALDAYLISIGTSDAGVQSVNGLDATLTLNPVYAQPYPQAGEGEGEGEGEGQPPIDGSGEGEGEGEGEGQPPIDGSGEGEGEGQPPIDGSGEGEGDGEGGSEGAGDGAGDGAGEGAPEECELSGIEILSPSNGATLILGQQTASVEAVARLVCDNQNPMFGDLVVEFTLDGSQAAVIDTDEFPVGSFALSIGGLAAGQHTLTVSAGVKTASSTFTVEIATAADDADENGLLDAFTRLGDGGIWISSVEIGTAGEVTTLVVGMVRWTGTAKQTAPDSVSISLSNADETARVTVVVPRSLLAANETGLLIVELAPDLDTLLPQSDAQALAAMAEGQPAAALSEYVEVTLVVETATGLEELDSIGSSILVILEGLDMATAATAGLFEHDTTVMDDPATGLQILAGTGGWTDGDITDSVAGTTITATISGLSTFAAFEKQAVEGAGEGSGEGTGDGVGEGASEGSGEGTGDGAGDGAGEGSGEGAAEGAGEGSGAGGGCAATAHEPPQPNGLPGDLLLLTVLGGGLIGAGRRRRRTE